jgi:hypothetical protein
VNARPPSFGDQARAKSRALRPESIDLGKSGRQIDDDLIIGVFPRAAATSP